MSAYTLAMVVLLACLGNVVGGALAAARYYDAFFITIGAVGWVVSQIWRNLYLDARRRQ